MPAELSPIDTAKFAAARRAVDLVQDGMKLGLGTGSTAAWMVRCLAERVREEGLRVQGVPTSTRTAEARPRSGHSGGDAGRGEVARPDHRRGG